MQRNGQDKRGGGIVFTPFHDLINTRSIYSGPEAWHRLTVGICAWLPPKSTKMKWKYQSVGPRRPWNFPEKKQRDWCLWTALDWGFAEVQVHFQIPISFRLCLGFRMRKATWRQKRITHSAITIKAMGGPAGVLCPTVSSFLPIFVSSIAPTLS